MVEVYYAPALAGLDGVTHGFFGRSGGVSDGIYSELNCGVGSRDNDGDVAENRRRVAENLAIEPENLLSPYQVHSDIALAVRGPWSGRERPRADAFVTDAAGLAVAITTADCTPVLFADPVARIVGAAHSGWKGAVGGVLEATVARMEDLGAVRKRILAAIGPCISQPNYEVGAEFEADFVNKSPGYTKFFRVPDGQSRPHFDLPGFVAARLAACGLAHIESIALCTYENESNFFSYRRATHRSEPDYGRQISAILLK